MNWTTVFECGCKVVIGKLQNAEIEYCPTHKAAPDMYEVLEVVREFLQSDEIKLLGEAFHEQIEMPLIFRKVDEVLAKAHKP